MIDEIDLKFANPFYGNRYLRFIRPLVSRPRPSGYIEEHHVLPKSMYPEFAKFSKHPWNRAYLTAREHFLAHWLLYKAYGGMMAFGFSRMRSMCLDHQRYFNLNSKSYEKLRRDLSLAMAEQKKGWKPSPESSARSAATRTGVKQSAEHRAKIALSNTGVVFTEERKRRISEAKKGKSLPPRSAAHLEKLRAPKHRKDCEHCGQSVALHLFKRFHGDNCKMKGQ